MADYRERATELQKQITAAREKLPEEVTKKMDQAVVDYMALRKACLEELIVLVAEERASTRENAARWTERCKAMRSSVPAPFENALKSLTLSDEQKVVVLGWQFTTIGEEEKFFGALEKVNAAEVRDYLVQNAQSLREYTGQLDSRWSKIIDSKKGARTDEQKAYKDIEDLVGTILKELVANERTIAETAAKIGSLLVGGAVFLAHAFAPNGVGDLAEMGAKKIDESTESYRENNQYIRARIDNYKSLVQAEKGGILPLFRTTRMEVYEYWEKNKTERAEDWLKSCRASLESWLSSGLTTAQQVDAKSFYELAYQAAEKHLSTVKSVAKEFEDDWNGLFKGPLSLQRLDELTDMEIWGKNVQVLLSKDLPSAAESHVANLEGYYKVSLERPLSELASLAEGLPDDQKANARKLVAELRSSIETSILNRIMAMKVQLAASFNWAKPASIQQDFDRKELADAIKD